MHQEDVYRRAEQQGKVDEAIALMEKALSIQLQLHLETNVATTLNNLGTTYEGMGLYEKALAYFSKALETHRAYQRERDVAVTLINIAGVYQRLKDWQKALGA